MSGRDAGDSAGPRASAAVRAADLSDLRLYHTAEHPCGYWPERQARDLVLDPGDPRLIDAYGFALAMGFRRSGRLIYRPHCLACRDCTPVRVPVAGFRPDRSQRRCQARNRDLHVAVAPAGDGDEHFALYLRYLQARHADGGMAAHEPEDFRQFLLGWPQARFLEIRQGADGPLLAVAVTDRVEDALSAVYTFYAPEAAARGLGTFAILQQLAWAAREGLDWLYLGYWIDGHPKMDYKRRFRPLQRYDGRFWRPMPED